MLDKELPLANQAVFSSTKPAPQSDAVYAQVVLCRKHCSIVCVQYKSFLLITPQVRGQQ